MSDAHERARAAWGQPGGSVAGPLAATAADIFAMRDLYEVERRRVLDTDVTFKPPEAWGFLFSRDEPGIALWRDLAGTLVGFVVARAVGSLGLIAGCFLDPAWEPLAIRGRMLMCASARLRVCGAQVIGVEIPSDNCEPLATWLDLGFTPTTPTIHYLWPSTGKGSGDSPSPWDRVSDCLRLADGLRPGLDLARDFAATKALGIGGVEVVEARGSVEAFAVYHLLPRTPDGARECRVRAIAASGPGAFAELIGRLQAVANRLPRFPTLYVRVQDPPDWAHPTLIDAGFASTRQRAAARARRRGPAPRRSRPRLAGLETLAVPPQALMQTSALPDPRERRIEAPGATGTRHGSAEPYGPEEQESAPTNALDRGQGPFRGVGEAPETAAVGTIGPILPGSGLMPVQHAAALHLAAGLTNTEVAKRCGVGRATIAKWRLDRRFLRAVEEATRVHLGQLHVLLVEGEVRAVQTMIAGLAATMPAKSGSKLVMVENWDARLRAAESLANRRGERGKPMERVQAQTFSYTSEIRSELSSALHDPAVQKMLRESPDLQRQLVIELARMQPAPGTDSLPALPPSAADDEPTGPAGDREPTT